MDAFYLHHDARLQQFGDNYGGCEDPLPEVAPGRDAGPLQGHDQW